MLSDAVELYARASIHQGPYAEACEPVLPIPGAFFHERTHALPSVRGCSRVAEILHRVSNAAPVILSMQESSAPEPHGRARLPRKDLRHGARFLPQLLVRHDPADEAERSGLFGAEGAAAEQELERAMPADDARQMQKMNCWDEAEIDFRNPVANLIPQVPCHSGLLSVGACPVVPARAAPIHGLCGWLGRAGTSPGHHADGGWRRALFRLDAGVLDHLAPFAELVLDQLRELLGRARECLETRIAESRFHLGAVDDLAQLGVEQRDDIRRRAGRREDAGPGIHVEASHSRLVERG